MYYAKRKKTQKATYCYDSTYMKILEKTELWKLRKKNQWLLGVGGGGVENKGSMRKF